MEEEINKKIEKVKSLLNNRFPNYFFNLKAPDYIEFELQFEGYKSSFSFKNSFGRKVDDLIFELKKNIIFDKISKEYLKLLLDELSMTISAYEQKNIRGIKFYFQSDALISVYDGLLQYFTIENVDKYLFDEVVKVSQLKYDYTIKLINELKKILHNDKQIGLEEMKLNIDEFFELLFDQDPHYIQDLDNNYEITGIDEDFVIVRYKNFKNPESYRIAMLENGRKILRQLKIDHSNQKINDEYLYSYLDDLKFEENNFITIKFEEKEYICHIHAYFTSDLPHFLTEKKYELNNPGNWLKGEFAKYNFFRHELIQVMIKSIESYINKKEIIEDKTHERLELIVPLSDITLLFRLLEENKVFKAKRNTHIHRVIQNSFNAPGKDLFNEGSIKNVFNDPEPNSVKNLEILLANMRISLKKF